MEHLNKRKPNLHRLPITRELYVKIEQGIWNIGASELKAIMLYWSGDKMEKSDDYIDPEEKSSWDFLYCISYRQFARRLHGIDAIRFNYR